MNIMWEHAGYTLLLCFHHLSESSFSPSFLHTQEVNLKTFVMIQCKTTYAKKVLLYSLVSEKLTIFIYFFFIVKMTTNCPKSIE